MLSLFIVSNPSFFRISSVSSISVHLLRPSGDSVHACAIISASCNSRMLFGLTGSWFLRESALETFFAVFSKSGFDCACMEYCKEYGVLMFDADQIAGPAGWST